jgi:hypothetical protein
VTREESEKLTRVELDYKHIVEAINEIKKEIKKQTEIQIEQTAILSKMDLLSERLIILDSRVESLEDNRKFIIMGVFGAVGSAFLALILGQG